MKFNFKIQQYQTDAVDAVVRVFNGQRFHDRTTYIRDLGKVKLNKNASGQDIYEGEQISNMTDDDYDLTSDTGYKNEIIELSDDQILRNIHTIQSENNIKLSPSLVNDFGRCSLDIEIHVVVTTWNFLQASTKAYVSCMICCNKV